jgi:hypothetical protein
MRYSINCFDDYDIEKLVYINLLAARAIANERQFESLVERLDKIIRPLEDEIMEYENKWTKAVDKTTAQYKPY